MYFPRFRGETNEDYTQISKLVIQICRVCTWKDLRGNHSLSWDTWDTHIDTWKLQTEVFVPSSMESTAVGPLLHSFGHHP